MVATGLRPAAGRSPPHDQPRVQLDLPGLQFGILQALDGEADRVFGHQPGDLSYGRQADRHQRGETAVVVADDGEVPGRLHTTPGPRRQQAHDAWSLPGEDGRREGRAGAPLGEQEAAGLAPGPLGVIAGDDALLVLQPVPAHRGPVGAAALGGAGAASAVDAHDPAVAEFHQVLHGLPYTLALGAVHEVDAGPGHPAADGDRGRAPARPRGHAVPRAAAVQVVLARRDRTAGGRPLLEAVIEITADLECPLMNPEFNGRPERAAESEAAFWRAEVRRRGHGLRVRLGGTGPGILGVHAGTDHEGTGRGLIKEVRGASLVRVHPVRPSVACRSSPSFGSECDVCHVT